MEAVGRNRTGTDARGAVTGAREDRRRERTADGRLRKLAENDVRLRAGCVGDCKVRTAVSVEIRRSHRNRPGAARKGGTRHEGATGTAEQRDNVGTAGIVGDDQVGTAVIVNVSDGDPVRIGAGTVGSGILERTVAVAEENAYSAVGLVGNRDIHISIAVEISGGHEDRTVSGS